MFLRSTLGLLFAVSVLGCNADDDPFQAERDQCVQTINDYRDSIGLPPLETWTDQEGCADEEARSDSQSGVAHGAFGQCSEMAQNECPGWRDDGDVEKVVEGCLASMWAEGPGEPYSEHGHYINMTNESYSKVSCGIYVTGDGEVWLLQNFR